MSKKKDKEKPGFGIDLKWVAQLEERVAEQQVSIDELQTAKESLKQQIKMFQVENSQLNADLMRTKVNYSFLEVERDAFKKVILVLVATGRFPDEPKLPMVLKYAEDTKKWSLNEPQGSN